MGSYLLQFDLMGSTDISSELIESLFDLIDACQLQGEVPAACILFKYDENIGTPTNIQIIASAYNQVRTCVDATAHAELLAIQKASKILGNERLEGISMLTTLEPCCMCTGAIIHARIQVVYYLLPTDKGLGMRTLLGQTQQTPYALNHYPEIHLLEEYSQKYKKILTSFFEKKR